MKSYDKIRKDKQMKTHTKSLRHATPRVIGAKTRENKMNMKGAELASMTKSSVVFKSADGIPCEDLRLKTIKDMKTPPSK